MLKRKKELIFIAIIIICVILLTYFLFKNKKIDYESTTALMQEVVILDHYEKEGNFFAKMDIELKPNLDSVIKIFEIDPKVYDKINMTSEDKFLGIVIKTNISNKDPMYDESLFSTEHLLLVMSDEYSEYHYVTDLSDYNP